MDKRPTLAKCWTYTIWKKVDGSYIDHVTNPWVGPLIPDNECIYRIEGKEISPQDDPNKDRLSPNGHHIQGYVHLRDQKRFNQLKEYHPTCHFGKANGTGYDNYVYCSKEDPHPAEFGPRPRKPKEKPEPCTAFRDAYQADTVEEGIKIIREKRPRDLAIHGEAIERNLKKAKSHKFKQKYDASAFNIQLQPLNKTTLIYGPSNVGKTHYAVAHFASPLLVSHIDDLKKLSPDNDGIVFDDMSFKHWPPESIIHLLDTEFDRTINVRYGTVYIPSGTKKIFTHNTDNPYYDIEKIEEEQRLAIERRFTRVNCPAKLYNVK